MALWHEALHSLLRVHASRIDALWAFSPGLS